MLFANNSNLGIVTAQFIDSGSMLSNYVDMVRTGDFNQSKQYHTSIYGWPGNNIIIWSMWAVGAHTIETQALIARSASFIFSILTILALSCLFYFNRASKVLSVVGLLLLVAWPPFVTFAYQIHPEAFGLFFGTTSLIAATYFVRHDQRSFWLYSSWGLAVLAFLSKQPFLIYLIPPVIIGFNSLLKSQRKLFFFIKTSIAFITIGALMVFISDPYIFLEFPIFWEKQVAIHTHHLSISNSLTTSLSSWANIIVFDDPWFLVGLIFSVVAIYRSKNLVVVSAAWANLAFLAVLIVALKFFFLRSYLYPALPTVLLVVATSQSYILPAISRALTTVLVGLALVFITQSAVRSAGILMTDSQFSQTANVQAVKRLQEIQGHNLTLVYSNSLPIDATLYKKAYGNFTFSPQPALNEQLKTVQPDIIITDNAWPFSDVHGYEQAAQALKMEKFELKIAGANPNACEYQDTTLLKACIAVLSGESNKSENHTYYIFVTADYMEQVRKIVSLPINTN
ncbi:hypothetical protein EV217_1293 [Phyllobacterium myrsinacearum]|nr:hypothetical protein EV217_1293 [Phyllobacterium myrsinacearum]